MTFITASFRSTTRPGYRKIAALSCPLRGGGSSVGRAPGCGPGGRGFESRPPPLLRTSVSQPSLVSLANGALVASLIAIAVVTLAPVESDNDLRLFPFSDIGEAVLETDRRLLFETAGNVLLFVPLGAALYLRGSSLVSTGLLAFSISVLVECAQLLVVSGRTTSVDDVMLNTLGSVTGYVFMSWSKRVARDRRETRPSGPARARTNAPSARAGTTSSRHENRSSPRKSRSDETPPTT
jgi:hypothetical protein